MRNLLHRAGTPYPRAIAVAARTMSTTSTAWTKLIRAKRLEQAHLGPEGVVVEIIEAALLVPAERPDQARADPYECGDAPPGIGVEDAPQSPNVERRLERATPSPDGAESDTEREQMECGEQPSDRHGQ